MRFEFWIVVAAAKGAGNNHMTSLELKDGADIKVQSSFSEPADAEERFFTLFYRGTAPDGATATSYTINVDAITPDVGAEAAIIAGQSFWGYRTFADTYTEKISTSPRYCPALVQ